LKNSSSLFALSRLTYGPSIASADELARLGLPGWLEMQTHPDDSDDPVCHQSLKELRLRISYAESKDWAALDEWRPLRWLRADLPDLVKLNDNAKPLAPAERSRPRVEIMAATLVRAVRSRWQLREILCDFWHNHFNVYTYENAIGVTLPVYDREVIRHHALGNFREFLEAVAKSPAMLYYLNNRASRSGAPNENYARELFELHTLGRDAYLNGVYNRWREVPGALQGKPLGYIDQDVYEAARAFTGWAVEDGSGLGGGQMLPKTGRFAYVDSWHDPYQKRILATEFDPYQPALADGQRVLDLAAFHPATARHICQKLCRRLLADQPSTALIDSAAKVWMANRDRGDQIARVVSHIALSGEFSRTRNAKLKRPLELVASFLRATGIAFQPTEGLFSEMDAAGQRLFGWPTPTGHPDTAEDWISVNTTRRRWSLIAGLTENSWGTGSFDALLPFAGQIVEAQRFVDTWLQRLYIEPPANLSSALLNAASLAPGKEIRNPAIARRLVAWAAMAPDYQGR